MGSLLTNLNGLKWSGDDLVKKFSESFVRATVINSKKKAKYIESGLVYISNPYVVTRETDDGSLTYGVDGRYYETATSSARSFVVPHEDFMLEEERPQPCISNCTYRYATNDGGVKEGDSAFMFMYNPARQWKRGFNGHNSYLMTPSQGEIEWNSLSMDVKYAYHILFPSHTTLPVALEQMRKDTKVRARAISNRYWLVRKGEGICLYSKKAPLGNFVGDRLFVGEGARLLSNEIMKELPEARINYVHL